MAPPAPVEELLLAAVLLLVVVTELLDDACVVVVGCPPVPLDVPVDAEPSGAELQA